MLSNFTYDLLVKLVTVLVCWYSIFAILLLLKMSLNSMTTCERSLDAPFSEHCQLYAHIHLLNIDYLLYVIQLIVLSGDIEMNPGLPRMVHLVYLYYIKTYVAYEINLNTLRIPFLTLMYFVLLKPICLILLLTNILIWKVTARYIVKT